MSGNELSLGLVFLAGIASFLSPCVLPIVPAYLSLISGLSFEQLQEEDMVRQARWRLFASALAFVLGFSVVIIPLFGSMASLINAGVDGVGKDIIRWVGGIIVLVFALHLTGVVRINAFFKERRFHVNNSRLGIFGAFLIGAAFAFGWSPCVGPILGGVFAFASTSASNAGAAWTMLIAYTIGLAVPFLLAAVFVNFFLGSMRKFTKHLRTVEITSGVLLMAMGVLLITDKVQVLGRFLEPLMQRLPMSL